MGSKPSGPSDKLGLVRLRGLMMGVFFKGWRRKAGCVVLVMACLLATAWMRSHVTRDVFHICSRDPVLYVASVDGAILLVKNSFIGKGHIAPTQVVKDEHDYWEPWEIRWHWRSEWCGFLFGSGVKSLPLDKIPPEERRWVIDNPIKDRRVDVWIIPHWSVVLPLTILSAYLLLWKPRSKPPRISN